MVNVSCVLDALTMVGAVSDSDSVPGVPTPFPSQTAPTSHGDPPAAVPLAGVKLHFHPFAEPDADEHPVPVGHTK